jgi:GNAT superfamily N-acetyltransferase
MFQLAPRRATLADLPAVRALQHAAYARNRAILGVEPLPLLADYSNILRDHEVWIVAGEGEAPRGVLVLDCRPDDLLIWSVASAPEAQGQGIGNALLSFAERRARESGRRVLRLYTGEKLVGNIAWYTRKGYTIEHVEAMPDRNVVHMVKTLDMGT